MCTSIFINTARGGIHNEQDLIQALEDGEIWGAGLDVTNPEPMHADNPLLKMPTVAVSTSKDLNFILIVSINLLNNIWSCGVNSINPGNIEGFTISLIFSPFK